MFKMAWPAAISLGAVIAAGVVNATCSRSAQAITPEQLQQQYGITDAYSGQVATPEGSIGGTLVPVTLPDGRKAELVIPDQRANAPHPVLLHDDQGLHPIAVQPTANREQVAAAPVV